MPQDPSLAAGSATPSSPWWWIDELVLPAVLYDGSAESLSLEQFSESMDLMRAMGTNNRLRSLAMRHARLQDGFGDPTAGDQSAAQRGVGAARRLRLYLHLLTEPLLLGRGGNTHRNTRHAERDGALLKLLQRLHGEMRVHLEAGEGCGEEDEASSPPSAALVEVSALLAAPHESAAPAESEPALQWSWRNWSGTRFPALTKWLESQLLCHEPPAKIRPVFLERQKLWRRALGLLFYEARRCPADAAAALPLTTDVQWLRLYVFMMQQFAFLFTGQKPAGSSEEAKDPDVVEASLAESNESDRRTALQYLLRLVLQYHDPELSLHLDGQRVDAAAALVEWIDNWCYADLPASRFTAASDKDPTFAPHELEGETGPLFHVAAVRALLPLVDYLLVLEKRHLLPYVAVGLLLSHRRGLLAWSCTLTTVPLQEVLGQLPLMSLLFLRAGWRPADAWGAGVASQLLTTASSNPQLATCGSVALAALPSDFHFAMQLWSASSEPRTDKPDRVGSSSEDKTASTALGLFQNAELLYRSTPLSTQRALLFLCEPASSGPSGAAPDDMATPDGEERPDVTSSIYEKPDGTQRTNRFYRQYYATLPTLPLEDGDVLQSFGKVTTTSVLGMQLPATNVRALPLRLLDFRAKKSFEYARLPKSIFMGDVFSLEEDLLRQFIARAEQHRGEHLVLFGTGAGSGKAGPSHSAAERGDEEFKCLLTLSMRLVQAARLPFVSLCLEGMEGMRRLIYHRQIPLERGPPFPVSSTTNTARPAHHSPSAVLSETGSAVLSSMKNLLFSHADPASAGGLWPSSLLRPNTTTPTAGKGSAPPPQPASPPSAASPASSSVRLLSKASAGPEVPAPCGSPGTSASAVALELKEKSEKGLQMVGSWGMEVFEKLREVSVTSSGAQSTSHHITHQDLAEAENTAEWLASGVEPSSAASKASQLLSYWTSKAAEVVQRPSGAVVPERRGSSTIFQINSTDHVADGGSGMASGTRTDTADMEEELAELGLITSLPGASLEPSTAPTTSALDAGVTFGSSATPAASAPVAAAATTAVATTDIDAMFDEMFGEDGVGVGDTVKDAALHQTSAPHAAGEAREEEDVEEDDLFADFL